MQIGSMHVLHFDQNKWAASLEFVVCTISKLM